MEGAAGTEATAKEKLWRERAADNRAQARRLLEQAGE